VLAALERTQGLDLLTAGEVADAVRMAADSDALIISDPRGDDGRALAAALRQPGCKVRWIQVLSAGYDGLAANGVPPGIVVTNQGGAVAPAVADHAMAMILAMARRIDEIAARSAAGIWDKAFSKPVFSLEDKTVAIVGFGNIGREVARRARGFGVTVLGLSRTAVVDPLADEMHPLSDLHQVLGRADIIVLCVASSARTRHIMDAAAFAAAKKGALFVNVTRGETVDQAALREALVSGQLGGAAIDVTEPEPLPPDDPLWAAPNLLISPHTAGGGSTGGGRRIAAVVVENLERFRAGRALINQVEIQ
jgi:phosphoglycerate dehydrogenase-like enzyme